MGEGCKGVVKKTTSILNMCFISYIHLLSDPIDFRKLTQLTTRLDY